MFMQKTNFKNKSNNYNKPILINKKHKYQYTLIIEPVVEEILTKSSSAKQNLINRIILLEAVSQNGLELYYNRFEKEEPVNIKPAKR
jgi:hypothetical protein